MKKLILSIILLLALALSGCGNTETEVVIIKPEGESEVQQLPPEESSPAEEGSTENEADIIEAGSESENKTENAQTEAGGFQELLSIDPAAVWDQYGYTHFKAEKSGLYNFSPVNSEGIDWEVYILDEEFTDAERYIPQVYEPALNGEGAIQVQEGKFIYVYSTANSWTMLEVPEGCLCRVSFK